MDGFYYTRVRPIALDPTVPSLLCMKPYPGHPKGCPNYGKKPGCPPNVRLLDDAIDLTKPVYAIYNVFPIGDHARRMRRKHPDWSDRQVYCCLYWQGTARKQLREKVAEFRRAFPNLRIVWTPEAMGTNLTETICQVGIELEWPPRKWAYQIVLAGHKRDRE